MDELRATDRKCADASHRCPGSRPEPKKRPGLHPLHLRTNGTAAMDLHVRVKDTLDVPSSAHS